MRFRKNGLCKILLVILFMVFISGGCGGGSSGSGGNSQSYNGNGNSNGNNGGQSGEINGTWEIVSGHGVASADDSGRLIVSHYTYLQGTNSEVNLEMTQNNSSTYYGVNDGRYTLKMSGDNIVGMGGFGALIVRCTLNETGQTTYMNFPLGLSFSNEGNGTYHMTGNNSANSYEYTLTLEGESTLRWTVYTKNNEATALNSNEKWQEIVLKKAGTIDNNTNTNTNNNTSPTPNTNNNTQSDIPPQISGSWKIASGSGLTSQTVSGRPYVSHLTYSPQRNDKAFDINITQNDSTTYYYGEHAGLFSLTLTGENIISSGVKGFGALRVYYSVAEAQGKETSFTFTGGKSFSYIGDGTYRLSVSNGTSYHEQTITLENESTIRWKYTVPSDGWYEIVLTKE